MKNTYILALLICSSFLLTTACSSVEDDCPVVPLSDYVLGEWDISDSKVTFNADGSLIDDDNILTKGITAQDISTKSYTLPDSTIIVEARSSTGATALTSYKILTTDCEEMEIEWVSGTTNFTLRK